MVGIEHIRMLATLMTLMSMNDKPAELISVSLIRAKMCELLAKPFGVIERDACFTVGLFSTLDAYLDCSIETAVNKLPLSEPVRQALLVREGVLGQVLDSVLAYERIDPRVSTFNVDTDGLRDSYREAVCWSETLVHSLGT